MRRLSAIMFTDIVGYTALMQVQAGDAHALKMRRRSAERERIAYSNTNGSPSANSPLTMITLTKPIERKG